MFSVFQRFVLFDINFISLLVFVLMSTSIGCQSNDSICKFIVRDGRVRDLGIYRFVKNESFSYRLFSREIEGDIYENKVSPIAVEHELEIENWNVSAKPSPISEYYGPHKFYDGVTIGNVTIIGDGSFRVNCRYIYPEERVCLLKWLFCYVV